MIDKIEKMKKLIKILNHASDCYYNSNPIMSDYDFDEKYEELKNLESDTRIVYPNSPTHNVGYPVADEIKKSKLDIPMLSLDKTKSVKELLKFVSNNQCVLSVKCDGLSLSLTYENGKLVKATTRGNGEEGSDVLQNALTISNIPHEIAYKERLVIHGETIIDWKTFEEINDKLPVDKKYKHPRNLVSGSLTLLDSKEASDRNMRFIAWRVMEGFSHKSVFSDLKEAEENGFEIVPMITYSKEQNCLISEILGKIKDLADEADIPYDGAVIAVDDYKIAESMGRTDKFFRHSYAYKYEDNLYETVLKDIEWNTSKTGLINPVAIFEPVNLDGTITTRATLHNVSYIKNMMLGVGDRIRIYWSNKVIPKVHDSIDKSGNFNIPTKCPACGGDTKVTKENDSEVLICTNPDCIGKLSNKLSHAVSKGALNIDGLSEATIQKFINLGWLKSIKDIYHLDVYKEQISSLDGFGKKSTTKLLKSIEKSRQTTLDRFLCALSIPLLGKTASKAIAESIQYDFGEFMKAMTLTGATCFSNIPGIGFSLVLSLDKYFDQYCSDIFELSKEFVFEEKETSVSGNSLEGMTFVITGSLNHFGNRDELKNKIESLGGKVSGSISSKTTSLINNDAQSTSSKNLKAKKLNIPIITEEEFINKYLQ